MATLSVDDVLRVVAEWAIPDGTVAQLVYHFIQTAGGPISSAQFLTAVVTALELAWDNIEDIIADEVLGGTIGIALYDFINHQFDGLESSPLVDVDGANITEMLPHGAAGLVKIFTAAARRQGRKYVHGLTEASNDAGTLIPTTVTDLALFAADLDDDVAAGGATFRYCTFNVDPLSALYETASIASGTVQAEAVVAYQRRRRPGTGI